MDAVRKADFAFVSGNGSLIRHRAGAVQALKFQGMSWVDVGDRPALSDALKGLREPGVLDRHRSFLRWCRGNANRLLTIAG